ncbi:MAG: hypothetical protein IJE24_03895 [Oscillospiraceae bacterium]|nr:hypothetical protein [Oscillospiraceae bacterium]
MDMIKAYFPFSFDTKDVKTLIIKIVVYLVIELVVGLVCGLIGLIPLIGGIIGWLVGGVVGLYCLAGIVFAVLDYFKILK